MRKSHIGFWSLACCCVALFTSACSKSAPTKADKVRIAYFPNITHAAALYAASTGGFQTAVGNAIRVEERVFTAGPAEIEALFAGEVDFGYIGPGPAINGYLKSNGQALEIIDIAASGGASLIAAKGQAIKSIKDLAGKRVAVPQTGGTQDISLRHALKDSGLAGKDKGGNVDIVQYAPSDALDLFRRGELDAAKGQAIKSIKDLAGKRVAVPQTGGTQDISLRHALKGAGLAGKDKGGNVDIVQYAPSDALDLFRRGELDAAWLPEPWVSRVIKDAGATLVTDERTLWPGGKFATAVVIVRKDFAKANPELVTKLIKAHRAAVDAINADKKSAGDVISKQIAKLSQGKTLSADLLAASLSRTDVTYEALDDSILTFADWAKELGYLKKGRDGFGGLIQNAKQ